MNIDLLLVYIFKILETEERHHSNSCDKYTASFLGATVSLYL